MDAHRGKPTGGGVRVEDSGKLNIDYGESGYGHSGYGGTAD